MMLDLLLRLLLYRSPSISLGYEERRQYEKLLLSINTNDCQPIEYQLPYPKYRFLYFLSLQDKYVFHGSNHHEIEEFEPRKQNLSNGHWSKSVFATTDPIWSIFYAVFDRNKLVGTFRNGCLVHQDQRYHYYSLSQETMKRGPWTIGMVYILPKQTFSKSDHAKVHFDEWVSAEPVKPIGKLIVSTDDFYFFDKVAIHKNGSRLLSTWLTYKLKTIFR